MKGRERGADHCDLRSAGAGRANAGNYESIVSFEGLVRADKSRVISVIGFAGLHEGRQSCARCYSAHVDKGLGKGGNKIHVHIELLIDCGPRYRFTCWLI